MEQAVPRDRSQCRGVSADTLFGQSESCTRLLDIAAAALPTHTRSPSLLFCVALLLECRGRRRRNASALRRRQTDRQTDRQTHTHTHPHTHTQRDTHTQTHTHSHSVSLSLSLSLTHTHACTRTPTPSHTHTNLRLHSAILTFTLPHIPFYLDRQICARSMQVFFRFHLLNPSRTSILSSRMWLLRASCLGSLPCHQLSLSTDPVQCCQSEAE